MFIPLVKSEYHGKGHHIFEKDTFRLLRDQKASGKLLKQPAGKKSILDFNLNKYKTRSQLIMDEYQRPNITEDKIYLIDKVVRMRGRTGRFGVDHSEILNYELELANQQRDTHMNQLVYKGDVEQEDDGLQLPGGQMSTANVLFKRLANKGTISTGSRISLLESENDKRPSARSVLTNKSAPQFQQWVRKKDAERRLRKKLLAEEKREIR